MSKWKYKQHIRNFMGVRWKALEKGPNLIYVLYSPYDGYTAIYNTSKTFSWINLDMTLESKIPAMLSMTDNKKIPTHNEVGIYIEKYLNKLNYKF